MASSSSTDAPNPRGIPRAVFISDVTEYMSTQPDPTSVDAVLGGMQEQYSKYKFVESRLSQNKLNLHGKMPEIRRTLEMATFLETRSADSEPISTNFELNDGLFAHAVIDQPKNVCLWLGANVMLEYPFDEALTLLQKNMDAAESQLKQINEDLEYIKDQITTTEVNIARVYNWDVKQRRIRRERGEIDTDKEA
eukprot:TRINITY_DN3500_c0_g1_i1.p1 TRINITY_DN3500_c0_g1~~TRINITY_DN3500_c0_g1_i1.p1  ORF type:complete len:194 (-),score=58.80 TRINITY_DN3500_c0_g1_i1:30-611(-)